MVTITICWDIDHYSAMRVPRDSVAESIQGYLADGAKNAVVRWLSQRILCTPVDDGSDELTRTNLTGHFDIHEGNDLYERDLLQT